MTREETIKVLLQHSEHWKRLLTENICSKEEVSQTVEALNMAIQALTQVSEIEENIIKYMKKYPNHVGNTDFWEGFYACRNVVLQLDNEYSPKEQEQKGMIAVYSMTNKDIAIYSKNGNLLFYTTDSIYEVMQKYNIDNSDVYIVF